MKSILYDLSGKKKSEVSLPAQFDTSIREDIVGKYFEADKYTFMHPYSTYEEAGKRHSASGRISHRRHKWRSAYGKGVSRVPRKTMWRRGTQFYHIGAEVSSARGGRVSHPPKGIHTERKINKKEKTLAFNIALASTFSHELISKRYSSLAEKSVSSAVIESLPKKTKDMLSAVKNIFGDISILVKNRKIRAGIGKSRGRKYKSNAGVLIITSSKENQRFKGFDIISVRQLSISDIYPLGRLALYTKEAIEEIGGKK